MSNSMRILEENNNSLMNNSSSKQMYSFSRAPRFPTLSKSASLGGYYDLPSVLSKRGTSLGYGNRYDFTLGVKSSNASFYNIGSPFGSGAPKFSFGLGRESYKCYCEGNKTSDKSTPGPAKYNVLKPFGSEAFKYSVGKFDPSTHKKALDTPGPANYDNRLNPEVGKSTLSRYKNISSIKFGTGKRFVYGGGLRGYGSPGPAEYEQKSLLGSHIFDSRFKTSPFSSLSGRTKIQKSNDNYPGPGQYDTYSPFGPASTVNTVQSNGPSKNASKILDGNNKSKSIDERDEANKEEKKEENKQEKPKEENKEAFGDEI